MEHFSARASACTQLVSGCWLQCLESSGGVLAAGIVNTFRLCKALTVHVRQFVAWRWQILCMTLELFLLLYMVLRQRLHAGSNLPELHAIESFPCYACSKGSPTFLKNVWDILPGEEIGEEWFSTFPAANQVTGVCIDLSPCFLSSWVPCGIGLSIPPTSCLSLWSWWFSTAQHGWPVTQDAVVSLITCGFRRPCSRQNSCAASKQASKGAGCIVVCMCTCMCTCMVMTECMCVVGWLWTCSYFTNLPASLHCCFHNGPSMQPICLVTSTPLYCDQGQSRLICFLAKLSNLQLCECA